MFPVKPVMDLVEAAGHLAKREIEFEDDGSAHCRICLVARLGNRPIQHNSTCEVGRIILAISRVIWIGDGPMVVDAVASAVENDPARLGGAR